MIGLGTLINSAAIIIGGILGLFFGKFINKDFRTSVMNACGLCVTAVGFFGAFQNMAAAKNASLMLIISIILGTVIGEILKIEHYIEKLGEWIKARVKIKNDAGFANGFVTASVTVCVGAMAVIGSINDGIRGDISVLLTKSVLDLVIIIALTAALGKGCIFSAFPVAVFQGSITALAKVISPFITEQALINIDIVGSLLIVCIGINLLWDLKIKTANMLPSIIIAVIFAYL